MGIPKHKTKKFFPGLVDQHVVTLEGVGVSAVQATVAANTDATDAQIIASASWPTINAAQAIPHSLGIAPTAVLAMKQGGADDSIGGVSFHIVTADSSAVYIRAATTSFATPVGIATNVISIR